VWGVLDTEIVVPEPATPALLLIGLVSIAVSLKLRGAESGRRGLV